MGWRRVRPAGKEGSLEGVGKIHNKISDNASQHIINDLFYLRNELPMSTAEEQVLKDDVQGFRVRREVEIFGLISQVTRIKNKMRERP